MKKAKVPNGSTGGRIDRNVSLRIMRNRFNAGISLPESRAPGGAPGREVAALLRAEQCRMKNGWEAWGGDEGVYLHFRTCKRTAEVTEKYKFEEIERRGGIFRRRRWK
ncbi:hypothetical protein Zmor_020406 [Zophobas morio]|uniref:Uncharacterized protein n=1 Tax=Zophobas morio TaxID=2755281 RepID=A0AA38I7K5_9CUCU|nr:hypothetical protein Zmor_020406 [Zophobas morio]